MSTILKALRRLEEQKSAATERPLRDEVVLTPRRPARRKGLVVAIAAALSFALVGAAMVALFDRVPAGGEGSIAGGDVAAPPDPTAGIAVADGRATEVFVATTASQPELRDLDGAPIAPVSDLEAEFELVRPTVKPRRLIPTMQVDPVAPIERDGPAPGSLRPSPRVEEPEYVEEEAPPERVARSDAPVHVDRTQWHPSPERRVAWVEVEGATALREVHEGERIGPYLVREIEPAAVLFSEGSVQIRREVGR